MPHIKSVIDCYISLFDAAKTYRDFVRFELNVITIYYNMAGCTTWIQKNWPYKNKKAHLNFVHILWNVLHIVTICLGVHCSYTLRIAEMTSHSVECGYDHYAMTLVYTETDDCTLIGSVRATSMKNREITSTWQK